ncbi:AmmeMemoRadiSam system protein A [Endozoicomonas sp. SM1973]|uniref:AmmeMemoRadiSam system protein A n=1 Tax=Spartinivicinus marinus TaxID=2994442 RepID=A0A853I2W8_9GAMM|nr:AmmeMemoRadiSam system protein A [Spartinivicinus marinus]MCX4025678.1 AmmeMemoRadiSam system protein A [Spartinivicinus marinus]NYZ68300.1 AmmeMemoRadiSam system protein A [Spartinivicinus marinus]
MPSAELTLDDQHTLLKLARQVITAGCQKQALPEVNPAEYSSDLQETRSAFVTLTKQHLLRGCIGSLNPTRPLVLEVSHNAHASAFEDYRFPNLDSSELNQVKIEISILSPHQLINFIDEASLINQLKPFQDGVILQYKQHRGTFLPQVWEKLPKPTDFFQQLKQKANLPPDFWSEQIKCYTYQVFAFHEN